MKLHNFTPGPWIIGDENNQHAQVVLGDSKCSVDLRRFADYPNSEGMSRDEMIANAHLISAAPELYGALAAWESAAEKSGTMFPYFAQAALAKARGEQP